MLKLCSAGLSESMGTLIEGMPGCDSVGRSSLPTFTLTVCSIIGRLLARIVQAANKIRGGIVEPARLAGALQSLEHIP